MASAPRKSKPQTGGQGFARRWASNLRNFFDTEIWEYGIGEDPSLKGQWIAFMRILAISGRGLIENRLFSRAAALSYSSLIALGPLVAIIVILSSSFIRTDAETQIKKALLFVAPSLQEMVTLSEDAEVEGEMATALDTLITQIIQGAEELLGQINTGGSKAFGALGSIILIWVVIQLLTSVENTLNQIWGVHTGRRWSQRIVFYWTFISLGALLGLGSTALFSASNIVGMFDWVPMGSEMAAALLSLSPVLSFLMLVILLALFYRFFPNTSVAFKPALVGSLLTATLLILNNYLSILYVHRVLSFQSLYGSVGIIPVMMIGLYFFWILILLGGQLTYAVQNVSLLANQAAWQRISPLSREMVTLSAFLSIARKFHECTPAPTMNEISRELHVPVNIINESLEILEGMAWITRIRIEVRKDESENVGFRPSRPLESYSLSRFKASIEQADGADITAQLIKADPLLERYCERLQWHEEDDFCRKPLNALLESPPESGGES